jgi:glycosyltransferase involved in cell wall biosynthesis
LVDANDLEELKKTHIILDIGIAKLFGYLLGTSVRYPKRWLKTLKLALKLSRASKRNTAYHIAYLAEACVLFHWLKETGATHIHAHFGTNSAEVAMLCSALSNIPYSFTVHGPDEFDEPQQINIGEKIQCAAFVTTISFFSKSQLCRWCDYNQWSKIHVIHCGLDKAFLNQQFSGIINDSQFVSVGRLSAQKGQAVLVEAMRQLVKEGWDVRLVLVGDGPLRSSIEQLISDYQLEEHIQITGWVSNEQVCQYIRDSSCLVLSSFAEGLPVVLMESLASRRPVVSTQIAGIPELVQPGINGWLIAPGSVNSLVKAMREVLETPKYRLEQMGKEGAAYVNQEHNAAKEAQKLAMLFQTRNDSALKV